MTWEKVLCAWLAAASIAAFFLCGLDKRFAVRHQWRIPERILMLSAVFGGSPGLLLGMMAFRHKTRHPKFYIGVPLILLAQAAVAWYLMK